MLQWYGNLPEETVWYKYRLFGEWQWVSIAMLVGFWAFPFVFLMSRWTKRIVPSLVFFAVVAARVPLARPVLERDAVVRRLPLAHGASQMSAGPLTGNTAYHTSVLAARHHGVAWPESACSCSASAATWRAT